MGRKIIEKIMEEKNPINQDMLKLLDSKELGKRKVFNNLFFVLFLILAALGLIFTFGFCLGIFHSSNFFAFLKYGVMIFLFSFFFLVTFSLSRKFEKRALVYSGELYRRMKEARDKREVFTGEGAITTSKSDKETVAGILSGKDFRLLDQDGDGKIAIHEYYPLTEKEVLGKILKEDEFFSKEKFYIWTRFVYQSLLKAFCEKKTSLLRFFEADSLYFQHKQKIDEYIQKKETRVLERVAFKGVLLKDYHIEGKQQILVVALAANLLDYLLDSNGKVIQGNSSKRVSKQYILTFIRNTGIKTTEFSNQTSTNCPNCGANIELLEDGKCSYCGSVLTTGKYGWVLLSIKDIRIIGEKSV